LLAIINDILDFSKGEANRLALETIRFDLPEELFDVFTSLAYRAQEKGLECILDIDPRIPSLVMSDPARLRQILINLLGNAIKFTHEGEVTLTARLVDTTPEGLHINFIVADSGIGVAEDRIDDLFESFTQADASTTRQYGGTGLGLAIVKQLCELMQGSITVNSVPGQGSEFCCHLFMALAPETLAAGLGSAQDLASLQGKQILIINGNEKSRQLLRRQLEGVAVTITEANNIEQAETLAATNTFDIAIIDTNVADSDFLKTCQQLRGTLLAAGLKRILLSPAADTPTASQLHDNGFTANVSKPVCMPQLIELLGAVVRGEEITGTSTDGSDVEADQLRDIAAARIMVAEDIPVNQELCVLVLNELGFEAIDIAANGLEAIQTLLTSPTELPFDLILMDCQMPELDGYATTQQIRNGMAGERYKDIPIIALTANAMLEDREKCLAAGMSDYVSKPIEYTALAASLALWLRPPTDKAPAHRETANRDMSTQTSKAVWDQTAALQRIGGNEAVMAHLVEIFIDSADLNLQRLDAALVADDAAVVATAAHAIKGAASNMGADRVAQLLQSLEQACKTQNRQKIIALRAQLAIDMDALKKVMLAPVAAAGHGQSL
jgi:two-component system sensor histidine kinase/response regulator